MVRFHKVKDEKARAVARLMDEIELDFWGADKSQETTDFESRLKDIIEKESDAVEILVALPDGKILPGILIGSDEVSDVALVKVEPPEPLPYLAFNENGGVLVGEWVIALGNPFGLFEAAEPSVTVGVVSATT